MRIGDIAGEDGASEAESSCRVGTLGEGDGGGLMLVRMLPESAGGAAGGLYA